MTGIAPPVNPGVVPWAIVASSLAALWIWFRSKKADRAVGSALPVYGGLGMASAFAAGSGASLGWLGLSVPTQWGWALLFFVFNAALFYAGWKLYARKRIE